MNQELSEYCLNLTGISQVLIDRQSKFPLVYQAFIDWLNQIGREKQLRYATPSNRIANAHCNTTFCSWTNWDLGRYFQMDCERNNLQWPPILRAWIDARKMFEVSSKCIEKNAMCQKTKQFFLTLFQFSILFQKTYLVKTTFAEALKLINIEQVGHAHSGIDDAKTLAKMMKHLYERGVNFGRVTDWRNQ